MENAFPEFEELHRLYYKRLHVYARTLGAVSADERDELSRDALVHVYFAREKYDVRRPLTPWVYAAARNYMRDILRSKRRASGVPLEDVPEAASSDDVEQSYIGAETAERVRIEIDAMKSRDREICMLVFYEQMSAAEAARVLGVPAGTVRWRLSEIRRHLRAVCGDDDEKN